MFDRKKLEYNGVTRTLFYDGVDTKISSRTLADMYHYNSDMSKNVDEYILSAYSKTLSELRDRKIDDIL